MNSQKDFAIQMLYMRWGQAVDYQLFSGWLVVAYEFRLMVDLNSFRGGFFSDDEIENFVFLSEIAELNAKTCADLNNYKGIH